MSTIVQRPGRSGYYLQVPVPKSLRSKLGNSIKRKAGNTHREALANRSKVEATIQRKFGVEMNTLSLIEKVEASYDSIPDLKGVTVGELPESDKEKLKDAYPIQLDEKGHAINPQEAALWLALDGKTTWQQWINRRQIVEARTKSTVLNWRSRLKSLATWVGSDYLSDLTKSQAIQYKEYLIRKGKEPSSIKNEIGCLNGFWIWGQEHEIVKTNIWFGLKKRLPDSEKKPIPPKEIFDAATKKASTTSSWRKEIDYQFLIQRYTGCRQGEAAGLRHCDIDLKNKTISFLEWEKIVSYEKERGGRRREKQVRRFKTKKKDERILPMSNALYECLKDMPIIEGSEDPIWPRRYKSTNDSWGSHWVSDYPKKYNLRSHDLRRFAITKLTLSGASPFIIYEIVRHKIEGMSEITMLYTRPTPEDLKEAIELIA